jgi:UDP-N-acetylglucosamine acyltransferase
LTIHSTAIVDPGATVAADAEIGPYVVIGDGVSIGSGTRVQHHSSILGPAVIGRDNQVYPFSSLGTAPQDIGYRNEPTRLEIGDRNVFREFVTVNRGTIKGEGLTRIGNDCYFMSYSHVAHDCDLGNSVIMANSAALGGHISIGDNAILGGLVAVHQFARIGRLSMIGGVSGVAKDVPPFMIASGERARLYSLNLVGLKRNGFSPEQIGKLKKTYRLLFRSGLILKDAVDRVAEEFAGAAEVEELLDFIRASSRGICRP